MLNVHISENDSTAVRIAALANGLQTAYHFGVEEGGIPLRIDPCEPGTPFCACRERGVLVSAWESEGIGIYLGVPREMHLLTLGMLGLIQWRALMGNAVLRPEDLYQRAACGCLFEQRRMDGGYPLLLERPRLCWHCAHFYESLCPERDMAALRTVIEHAASLLRDGCAV